MELVTEYLEGALPESERVRLEEHLAACRSCRTYLDQMRQVVRMLGRLTEEDLPQTGRTELMEMFQAWKTGGLDARN